MTFVLMTSYHLGIIFVSLRFMGSYYAALSLAIGLFGGYCAGLLFLCRRLRVFRVNRAPVWVRVLTPLPPPHWGCDCPAYGGDEDVTFQNYAARVIGLCAIIALSVCLIPAHFSTGPWKERRIGVRPLCRRQGDNEQWFVSNKDEPLLVLVGN